MKSMIVALLMSVVLVQATVAGEVANQTRLYKLSGSVSIGYAGDVKSGLPKTAYIALDTSGNSYILWYWTKDGNKYMSEPMYFSDYETDGFNSELFWLETDLYQDAAYTEKKNKQELTINQDQTAYGDLEMAGAGNGEGGLPSSLAGSYYNEAYDNDEEEYLGFGIGTCFATTYKTLTGEEDSAESAIMWIAEKLMQNGYEIPEDNTAVYQEL